MKKGAVGVFSALAGVVIGTVVTGKRVGESVSKQKEYSDKHLAIIEVFNQWMITKQENKSIADYFHEKNIKSIAIYGMSFLGKCLYNELVHSDIEIKYAIDRCADNIDMDLDVVAPENGLRSVDAIVVTAVYYFDDIVDLLERKTEAQILSLEDILYEI